MTIDTVSYWKDVGYREWVHDNHSEEEIAAIPANPAGYVELDDEDLGFVSGGALNSGTRNRRWGGTPTTPDKPKKPTDPDKRWRKYRPRPSVKRR